MLGRHVLRIAAKERVKKLLEPIRCLTKGRHVIANLESPLVASEPFPKKSTGTSLCAPISMAQELHEAGLSVVSLANNHVFDGGERGLKDTIDALDRWNIGHVGAGENCAKATLPHLLEIDSLRVGILGFSYSRPAREDSAGVAYLYDSTVQKTIAGTRNRVDFLIVLVHSGIELFQYPLPRDQKIYQSMIDQGADLIIGGHSHCVQAMEVYRGKFVFYSLGDCIFDHHLDETWKGFWKESGHPSQFNLQASPELPRHSLAVMLDFKDGKERIRYEPLKMGDLPGPVLMTEDEKKKWLLQFEEINSNLMRNPLIKKKRESIQEKLLLSLEKRTSTC